MAFRDLAGSGALLLVAGATAVASGCASGDVPDSRGRPPGATLDGGCTEVVHLDDPSGCRSDWSCSDAGLLVFACGELDGGRRCACLIGEATEAIIDLPGDPCEDGGIAVAASSACGWAVP